MKMNRSRNWTSIVLQVVFIICFMAWNLSPALAAEKTRLGFIDFQKAVTSTKEFKRQIAAFQKDFQKEQTIIASKEKRIKKMFDDLSKQSFVLDPNRKQEKEERFRKQQKDFERYIQDRKEEFSRKEKQILDEIINKMKKIVQKIGKEKKTGMIMDQSAVLYYASENDLTDLAIRAYDRNYK